MHISAGCGQHLLESDNSISQPNKNRGQETYHSKMWDIWHLNQSTRNILSESKSDNK